MSSGLCFDVDDTVDDERAFVSGDRRGVEIRGMVDQVLYLAGRNMLVNGDIEREVLLKGWFTSRLLLRVV